jgi:hypothetical protein
MLLEGSEGQPKRRRNTSVVIKSLSTTVALQQLQKYLNALIEKLTEKTI